MSKLVQFPGGSYGVRTYWFFGWHFRDLESPRFEWTRHDKWFECCKGTLERAEQCLYSYKVIK